MEIDHKIQKLTYTVSFEDGVGIEKQPSCVCVMDEQDGTKVIDIPEEVDYDLLYTKYTFHINNPKFGSNIKVSWKYNDIE